ncbi:MAG: hypothetical protein OEV01_06040 [Nitrospira sp.]|nr:hypothetical protein [Nitrospira sp.]MDH4305609.1 hypothetical protein [Nitrospira sp.]MDH5195393.1 hypothetical protein [Nitrospira sp.]
MNCTRCQGLMLEEHMIDMEGGYGEMWSVSTRCVNCGHRDDAVIQHHRQLYAKPVMETSTVHEVVDLNWESAEVESLAA